MNDPLSSLEIFNMGITSEQVEVETRKIEKNRFLQMVRDANDFSFGMYKKRFFKTLEKDPMMMPVIITAIGEDWIMMKHGMRRHEYKKLLHEHKIVETVEYQEQMAGRQREMMMIVAGQIDCNG